MLCKAWRICRDFADKMKKKNIASYAAGTAFFFFLSLVPMLILICMVLPYTPLTEENLVDVVTGVTPAAVDQLVTDVIEEVYRKSAGAMSVAAIATIWSACKGVLALMRGLNAINEVEEKRNFLSIRLIACFYTVVMMVVLILFLFVMVFGNQLMNLMLYRVPQLQYLVSLYMEFRFLVVWVFLTPLFAAIYAYVPDKRLCFKEQIPGASFTAVVWSVFSWGFSLYVSRFQAYSIYGSLSIIVIIMIWMYFGMYIIMIGAYLNRYFEPVNKVLMGTNRDSLNKS
ncbi:MAG: YihY/virulence factor BrkB family protein [Clostridium sp.]|nr:YihY/virulence factor BrkB family protein [Acetatifactor muris]MCM1528040.1 YihY/virulence factor BrkB family protein [Bacteroides sp.]MCM1564202.1 YihY/virulence factor BrkB family protein [Clostridium sp.]